LDLKVGFNGDLIGSGPHAFAQARAICGGPQPKHSQAGIRGVGCGHYFIDFFLPPLALFLAAGFLLPLAGFLGIDLK
jgi:hypothetical protein